ncbi:MAG: hypothetical protein AAF206_23805 [Bacteroidota bacterium]
MKQYFSFKAILFLWISSYATAVGGYFLLNLILDDWPVFGRWFRMFLYHEQHPLLYIAIPCFFYGLIGSFFLERFLKQKLPGQIVSSILIALLSLMLATPLGSLLWVYHDMQAGYFPANWFEQLFSRGFDLGFTFGWLIVLFSFPYNLLGLVVSHFLNLFTAERFY